MPRALFDASPSGLRRFERLFSASTRARGLAYAAQGRVTITDASDTWLAADVRGSDRYEVELELRGKTACASCTCPHFSDQLQPCKHLWATLLLAGGDDALPWLREARTLMFDFDAAGEDLDFEVDEDDADALVADDAPPLRIRRGPAAPVSKPARGPSWREILRGAPSTPAPIGGSRELHYVVDPEQTREQGRLVVRAMERSRGGRGGWALARLPRPLSHSLRPEDLSIVGMLDAVSLGAVWYGAARSAFDIPVASARAVLEPLCRSGRAHVGSADAPPLRWDGAAYALALEVGAAEDSGAWQVRAWLERDDPRAAGGAASGGAVDRVAATEPALVLAGGCAFWADRVAPFDDAGQFAWVSVERGTGAVSVPAREIEDLVEALHRSPAAPRLRLPPELELTQVRAEGRPYASLRTARRALVDGGVAVEAGMDYGGVRVPLQTRGAAVFDRGGRRLLLRDADAEAHARVQLEAAGARRLDHWRLVNADASDEAKAAWRLAIRRLEGAVRELVVHGWRVEVDGKLRRALSDFSVEVTSGIDWLDARVHARFGDAEAPLPELLAALRNKRTTVLLADGTVGELSDAAVESLRRWASMADPSEGSLRFRTVQTALVAALMVAEGERASCDEAFARARAELDGFAGVRPLDPPASLRGTLRDYQRHGLGWFEALRRFGFGGCLADDMGLGKTVQVLALLDARRKERPRPGASLVVAPRSVLSNWASEAARFTPELRVFLHDGPDREPPGEQLLRHDLVLTTYGLLRQDALALARVEFDYVVLDEAQAIKTAGTATAKAARLLRAKHRLALTGTPVENHLGELASLIDFLNPGVLGAASAMASLAQGARRAQGASQELLGRAVRPFFLRRTKREVAPELPDRVEQTIACELEGEQRRLYDELHAHYRRSLSRHVARHGVARSTAHILEALLRLRQAACHPGLVDESRRGGSSAKLDTLLEQLAAVRQQGQKALVFSQFTSLLAIVRDRLDAQRVEYAYLDGATRDRRAVVERFQTDERCGVFLLSLKAGGVGLNLTAAEYVFLLDPWWNPAVEAQAIDRAHRIGQTRTVFAYRLLARGTVEEKVAELQGQKREVAEALFGENGAALTGLTREDLELLLA